MNSVLRESLVDAFRIFRSCFYCKGRFSLLQVVNPGYNTTYDYYHQECLDHVLKNPEKEVKFLDMAIQITDQLVKDREHEETKRETERRQIQRATELAEQRATEIQQLQRAAVQRASELQLQRQQREINVQNILNRNSPPSPPDEPTWQSTETLDIPLILPEGFEITADFENGQTIMKIKQLKDKKEVEQKQSQQEEAQNNKFRKLFK
jgi:hypothetical protein